MLDQVDFKKFLFSSPQMKGGLGARELPESPPRKLSVYNSQGFQNSPNGNELLSLPIPISELDTLDVSSLFSPQFTEVNQEAVKNNAYQPIPVQKSKHNDVWSRLKRTIAPFYFKHTVLVKCFLFIIYYIVGVSYYSTKEPWTILER